jgi:hypothetical protein
MPTTQLPYCFFEVFCKSFEIWQVVVKEREVGWIGSSPFIEFSAISSSEPQSPGQQLRPLQLQLLPG